MKVIFLDFDGVVVAPDGRFSRDAVTRVAALAMEFDAAIVFSTSWRYNHSAEAMRRLLINAGLPEKVPCIDSIPVIAHDTGVITVAGTRGQEITKWLEENPQCDGYIILDDCCDMMDGHRWKVPVQGHLLFSDNDLRLARRHLPCSFVERNQEPEPPTP